jgi:hypothetical protein
VIVGQHLPAGVHGFLVHIVGAVGRLDGRSGYRGWANSVLRFRPTGCFPPTARHEATKSYGGFVTISGRSPRILRREQGVAAPAKRIVAEAARSRLRSMDMLVGRDTWLRASHRIMRTFR